MRENETRKSTNYESEYLGNRARGMRATLAYNFVNNGARGGDWFQ